MNNPDIGFVKLHIPGRSSSYVLLASFVIVIALIAIASNQNRGYISVIWICTVPFIALFTEISSRKKVLTRKADLQGLALELRKLSIQWLYFRRGRGIRPWGRIERGIPRTVADSALQNQLSQVVIPDGLIEPERVRISKPGTMLGCIVGSFVCLLIAASGIRYAIMGGPGSMVGWVIALIFGLNVVQLVLGLPIVHRSRRLPGLLRHIGRHESMLSRFVVGPGWIKIGKRLWRADRDLLLIRRTGWRRASAELDCLLVGPDGRRRLTFSGVGDDDFRILFGGWNCSEIRTEFVDSELS